MGGKRSGEEKLYVRAKVVRMRAKSYIVSSSSHSISLEKNEL